MPYNIYSTIGLMRAVEKIYPVVSWLGNRYFPTSDDDIYPGDTVLFETMKGSQKMAPFVIPMVGGVAMEREGYRADEYAPPLIQPKRSLTIDDLNRKGFGEHLYENRTPEQRQQEVLGRDLRFLYDSIDRRKEWMCAQVLINGRVVVSNVVDNSGKKIDTTIRFYDESDGFQNIFTPEHKWNEVGGDIYGTLEAMVAIMSARQVPTSDLVLTGDLVKEFLSDPLIEKLYNNRRYEMGSINPVETPEGVANLGTIVVRGKVLNLFAVDERVDGVPLLGQRRIFLSSPGMGRTAYASITQLEDSGEGFRTYTATHVPKYLKDVHHNTREIMLSSRPLPMPNDVEGWLTAEV